MGTKNKLGTRAPLRLVAYVPGRLAGDPFATKNTFLVEVLFRLVAIVQPGSGGSFRGYGKDHYRGQWLDPGF